MAYLGGGKHGNVQYFERVLWRNNIPSKTTEYLAWKEPPLTSAWPGQRKIVTALDFVKSVVPDFDLVADDMCQGEGVRNRLAILCSASYAGPGDHLQIYLYFFLWGILAIYTFPRFQDLQMISQNPKV